MTEYEYVRNRVEREAIDEGAMTEKQVDYARETGAKIVARCGLTPERVWAMTRSMRKGA